MGGIKGNELEKTDKNIVYSHVLTAKEYDTVSYGMHMSNSHQWSLPCNGMFFCTQFWICDDQLQDSKLPPSRLHPCATPTSLNPGWCGAVDGAVWVGGASPNKLLLPHGFK